jgi:hypothetical protein
MKVMMNSYKKGSYDFKAENITGNVIWLKSKNYRALVLSCDIFYIPMYAFPEQ